jgi:Tfp pilus assembly protein PilF
MIMGGTFILSVLSMLAAAQELPPEMEHLKELAAIPSDLVETAYQYHRSEIDAIENEFKTLRIQEKELTNLKRRELQSKADNVEKVWKYVLSVTPGDARANNYYGELLFDYLSREEEGYQLWLRAAKLDPEYPSPINNLGLLFFHNGQYEKGHDYLKKAIDLDPKHPDFLFNMAQMYMSHFPQLGKILDKTKTQIYKDAMKMSEKAARYAPDEYEIVKDYANNFYLAENFGAKTNWTSAAKTWAKVVPLAEAKPDIFHALINEGRTWLKANQKSKAKSALEKALKIQPDSRVAKQLYEEAKSAGD